MVTMFVVWHITLTIHLLLLLFASSFSPPCCTFSNNGRRRIITSSPRQRLRQLKNVPSPLQFSRQRQHHLLPIWDFDPQNPSRLRKLCLSKSMNDHDHDGDGSAYEPLRVAGASVSPLGFLVILKASFLADEETDIVFPVQLTCSSSSSFKSFPTSSTPSTSASDSQGDDGSENKNTTSEIGVQNDDGENTNNNGNNKDPKRRKFTIPALFRENIDQTSVTTPEALTFLQLLNGVDMATPVFPPDSLSKIAVFYSFLSEDRDRQQREEEVEHTVSGEGEAEEEETADVLQVEDELGLSSSSDGVVENGNTHQIKMETSHSNKPAFDYIRSMIQTTLPPGISYLEASIWQRAKVQLPRVWLHGVRLEELDDSTAIGSDWEEDCENRYVGGNGSGENECSTGIATVPIRYILECSVDDKSKRLDIPLYAIPSSLQILLFPETSRSALHQQLEISNELLREISHSYHMETSAAFTSLALFQRYFKSSSSSGGGGSGPTLKVSTKLLQQLMKKERARKNNMRYCWTKELESKSQKTAGGNDVNYDDDSETCTIDDVIQYTDLPMYRPLTQLREEDQRVLSFLKKQNFGKGSSGEKADKNDFEGNDSKDAKTKNGKNGGSDGNAAKCDRNQAIDDSSSGESDKDTNMHIKKTLTLEQQAKQQQLKAAWKIAIEKGDEGALEKIQIAMEEMEKEIMENGKNENDDMAVEYEEESSLEKIQRAMRESGGVEVTEKDRRRNVGSYDEDEDIVGLISELEEATNARFEEEGDE